MKGQQIAWELDVRGQPAELWRLVVDRPYTDRQDNQRFNRHYSYHASRELAIAESKRDGAIVVSLDRYRKQKDV